MGPTQRARIHFSNSRGGVKSQGPAVLAVSTPSTEAIRAKWTSARQNICTVSRRYTMCMCLSLNYAKRGYLASSEFADFTKRMVFRPANPHISRLEIISQISTSGNFTTIHLSVADDVLRFTHASPVVL